MNKKTGSMWMVLGIVIGLIVGISLSKLAKRPESSKSVNKELYSVTQHFINNRIARADTLNFKIFSKSSLEKWKQVGMADATIWASFIQVADPIDSAEILGAVLFGQDTARVFVGHERGNGCLVKVYQFVKELNQWKFNGYEFDYENEEVNNTPEGLLK